MISGVNGASSVSYDQKVQPAQPQPVKQVSAGQDSVELSGAAKAGGDVDHDGDSK
jgi:hypothetical protein